MISILHESGGFEDIKRVHTQYKYMQGVLRYRNSLEILENSAIRDFQGEAEGLSQRTLAIEDLEKSLMEVGSCEQQLAKIDTYLLLLKMSSDGLTTKTGDEYFYGAVEIARRYLGDDYIHTSYGDRIMKMYTTYIDPTIKDRFSEDQIPFLMPLLHPKIILEAQRRETLALEKVADIANFITGDDSSDEIVSKLERVLGPMRILIISQGSSQVLVSHRLNKGDTFPSHVEDLSINIFDKPREYIITIDRGSNEARNEFKQSHREHVIDPIIRLFITKKEYELSFNAFDNTDTIELIEKNIPLLSEVNDYDGFIADTLSEHGISSVHGMKNDIDVYSRAIDICRWVILSIGRDNISQDDLLQNIDVILGARIDLITLNKVQSMLLSCHETMNGIGYPFGLNKDDIPLEGRMYSIIRAYEALYFCYGKNQKKVLETMQKWARGGYIDFDILDIFLKNLEVSDIPTKQIIPISHSISDISPYRSTQYKKYLDSWFHQLKIIRSIEDQYYDFRIAHLDKWSQKAQLQDNNQNAIIKKINELALELRKLTLIRKLVVITRHGSTISDTPDGPPGDDSEVLTTEGIESSHTKGIFFDGLEFRIVTSPLVRACQTAAIICQRVRGCTCKILDSHDTLVSSLECSGITTEDSIGNPQKNIDNGRYNSLAQKISVDNTSELLEYLMKMVSSGDESMTLFITHRDSGRHLIFWLKNLFSQDRIHGEKTPIDNDTIIELYFCGDHIIEGEEAKTKGLLFSTFNWKSTLHEVNSIVESIFGDVFYLVDDERVELIRLHDIFINFIHRNNEEFSEKVGILVEQLKQNPVTKHFPDILKGAGLI